MNFSPTCRQKPECQCSTTIYCQHNSGLLIFRGKKSKISRDFQGQIRGKIGRFRGENKSKFAKKQADFAGVQRQKVKFRRIFRGKFAEKSAGFAGFSQGKQVEIRRKIGQFRWGLAAKSQISKDFQGQIRRKIG